MTTKTTLKSGTHNPGATIGGKTVRAWRCWSTTTRYDSRGAISDIVVEFTDGSTIFAESIRA